MKARSRFATALGISVLASGLMAGVAQGAWAAPDPIVIAVEAPLSGSQAANGQDMLRGVKLAVREVNAAGGVLGRQVRILPVDDQANPDLAQASVTKAKKAGAAAVIGPYNSSVGVVNLPLYLSSKIVPVHMTSTNDTDGEGVTVQPKNDQISPVELAYVQSTGAKSVAMLVDPSLYTQGMADRLSTGLSGAGVSVTQIPITEGLTDYSAQVNQALAGNPDLVYVSTYYPEGSKIAEALAASNSADPSCLMGLANVDPSFISESSVATAQRCVFSGVPTAAEMPGKRAAKFVRDYRKTFDKEPGVWGIFTYDSAKVLFAAMKEAGKTSFAPVLGDLKQTKNYPGATGTITIDPSTGNREVVPVYILEVDDRGEFVIAGSS